MVEKPRVLVASPVYSGMRYCIDRFLGEIQKLSYSNCGVLLVDNSDEDEFFKELSRVGGIKVIRDKMQGTAGMEKIVASRNKIIEYAIAESYDYILMMDCDVLPPENIIEELLSCGKDIVSGIYMNYFISSGQMKTLPVAWMEISEEEFEKIKEQVPGIKSREEIRRHMTIDEMNSNKLFKVLFPSAGCMLISRKVFGEIKYGLMDMKAIYGKDLKTTDDIYFFNEAKKNGFELFCYTKMRCDHLVGGKYEKDSSGNLVYRGLKKD